MSKPSKVTVLMPVRDTREDWLWTAICSVVNQSYPNLDLVMCDDGSTKASTVEYLKEAVEGWPDRVRLVRNDSDDHGSAHALDRALDAADAETVYFTKIDSDDFCHPDREKNRVALFETLPPQVALIYDNYFQLVYWARDQRGQTVQRPHIIPVSLRPYDYRALLEHSYIHGNAMWRASVYERIPRTFLYDGYDNPKGPNKHGEDYNLWLSITDYWDGFWMDVDPAYTWTYRVYQDSKYHRDRRGVDYCRTLLQHRAKERRGLL